MNCCKKHQNFENCSRDTEIMKYIQSLNASFNPTVVVWIREGTPSPPRQGGSRRPLPDTLRCSPITSQGFSSHPPPPLSHMHTHLLTYSFTPPRNHTFRQKIPFFSAPSYCFPFSGRLWGLTVIVCVFTATHRHIHTRAHSHAQYKSCAFCK